MVPNEKSPAEARPVPVNCRKSFRREQQWLVLRGPPYPIGVTESGSWRIQKPNGPRGFLVERDGQGNKGQVPGSVRRFCAGAVVASVRPPRPSGAWLVDLSLMAYVDPVGIQAAYGGAFLGHKKLTSQRVGRARRSPRSEERRSGAGEHCRGGGGSDRIGVKGALAPLASCAALDPDPPHPVGMKRMPVRSCSVAHTRFCTAPVAQSMTCQSNTA